MRMMHLRADTSSTLPSARSRKKQLVHSSNFWWSRTCTARTPAPSCARARAASPSAQARARGACGGCACGARAAPRVRAGRSGAARARQRGRPGPPRAGRRMAGRGAACEPCHWHMHHAERWRPRWLLLDKGGSRVLHLMHPRGKGAPDAPGGHGSSKQALAGGWGRAFCAGVSWPALISSSTMWCSYCARASAAAVRSRACLEALAGRSALPHVHVRGQARRPSGAGCQHRGTRRARHVAPGARGAPR